MSVLGLFSLTGLAGLSGCKQTTAAPLPLGQKSDYGRPLPPGVYGLRQLPQDQWPDITPIATQLDDRGFQQAADRSIKWFGYRSTQQHFPSGPISHDKARASTYAMRALAELPFEQRLPVIQRDFDIWTSVGWDGSGTVLFTGYFSPEFQASATRQGPYQYPLYKKPADLQIDPSTGKVLGRQIGGPNSGQFTTYPTRRVIEQNPQALGLVGQELVWLQSPLDVYIIQVNGSAKLTMAGSGQTRYIGYAGTNGAEYTSIGKLLVQDGVMSAEEVSLASIRTYFQTNPDRLNHYVMQNDRFVFFQDYTGDQWPAGSLGFKVQPMFSLATDKAIYPRGCVTFVQTTLPTQSFSGGTRPFTQLMLDQDTGGAIRAPGRADIYIGIGNQAESIAGRQAAEGRLYYLLLKDSAVPAWLNQAQQGGRPTPIDLPAQQPISF